MTMIPVPVVYQNLVTLDIDAGQHTLISLKPAEVSLSLTDFTAWNGVGEALTNDKKSFAAVLILAELMVAVLNPLLKIKLRTMYLNRVGRFTFQVKIDTRVEGQDVKLLHRHARREGCKGQAHCAYHPMSSGESTHVAGTFSKRPPWLVVGACQARASYVVVYINKRRDKMAKRGRVSCCCL